MTDINKVNDEALENVTGGARRIVSGSPVGYAHVRTGPAMKLLMTSTTAALFTQQDVTHGTATTTGMS